MAVGVERAQTIRLRLSKKATFEAAAAELCQWIHQDEVFADSKEAYELAARCITLLRSRYGRDALPFWKASVEVFEVSEYMTWLALKRLLERLFRCCQGQSKACT